jgi:hypothetical protein
MENALINFFTRASPIVPSLSQINPDQTLVNKELKPF